MLISGGFVKDIYGSWISLSFIVSFEIEVLAEDNKAHVVAVASHAREHTVGVFDSEEVAQYELDRALKNYCHWTGQNG